MDCFKYKRSPFIAPCAIVVDDPSHKLLSGDSVIQIDDSLASLDYQATDALLMNRQLSTTRYNLVTIDMHEAHDLLYGDGDRLQPVFKHWRQLQREFAESDLRAKFIGRTFSMPVVHNGLRLHASIDATVTLMSSFTQNCMHSARLLTIALPLNAKLYIRRPLDLQSSTTSVSTAVIYEAFNYDQSDYILAKATGQSFEFHVDAEVTVTVESFGAKKVLADGRITETMHRLARLARLSVAGNKAKLTFTPNGNHKFKVVSGSRVTEIEASNAGDIIPTGHDMLRHAALLGLLKPNGCLSVRSSKLPAVLTAVSVTEVTVGTLHDIAWRSATLASRAAPDTQLESTIANFATVSPKQAYGNLHSFLLTSSTPLTVFDGLYALADLTDLDATLLGLPLPTVSGGYVTFMNFRHRLGDEHNGKRFAMLLTNGDGVSVVSNDLHVAIVIGVDLPEIAKRAMTSVNLLSWQDLYVGGGADISKQTLLRRLNEAGLHATMASTFDVYANVAYIPQT